MGCCCSRPSNAVADDSGCTGGVTLGRCVGDSTTRYGPDDQNQDIFRVLSLDGLSPDGDAQTLHARRKKPWEEGDPASAARAGALSPLPPVAGAEPNFRTTAAGPSVSTATAGVRTSKSTMTSIDFGGFGATLQALMRGSLRASKPGHPLATSKDGKLTSTMRSSKTAGINGTIVNIDEADATIKGRLGTSQGRKGNGNVDEDDTCEYYHGEDGEQLHAGDQGDNDDGFSEVAASSAVKVAVMVRPLLDFEVRKDANVRDIVMIMPPCKIRLPKKPSGSAEDGYNFDFDRVYKADSPAAGKQMFAQLVLPVVERFCQGFNGTVLAYGQTGSGKTYTMGTSSSMTDVIAKEPQGVIPRTMNVLFNYVQLASQKYDLGLKAIYFEIYNEQIYDLLREDQSKNAASKLDIREKPNGEIFVEGVTEMRVESKEEIAAIIDQGNANRATAAHKMNAESSRSHAVLMLVLEQRAKLDVVNAVPEDLRYLRSKLCLVDLAGSERVKETGTTGDRFSEGININKGLLELGNVINALTEGKKRTHVPYRNSKLTRVLQDSLGGNSETLFLACISPADSNHDHTVSTLRYAQRARAIRNNLRLNNKLSMEEEVEYLRNLVIQLQKENAALKRDNALLRAAPPLASVPEGEATE